MKKVISPSLSQSETNSNPCFSDAERLQKRKAAADALTQIELEFAKLRDKYVELSWIYHE